MEIQVAVAIIWSIWSIAIWVFALNYGSFAGKYVTSGALAAWLCSLAIAKFGFIWSGPSISLLAVDAMFWGYLVLVALNDSRFWPLIVSGFQLCSLLLHLMSMTINGISPQAYYLALQCVSFLVLFGITIGTWTDRSGSQ